MGFLIRFCRNLLVAAIGGLWLLAIIAMMALCCTGFGAIIGVPGIIALLMARGIVRAAIAAVRN